MRGRHKLTVFTTKSACPPLLINKISSFTLLLSTRLPVYSSTCLLVNLQLKFFVTKCLCMSQKMRNFAFRINLH